MHNRFKLLSLFLISTATLLFEIDLSRLFSVAQFYHFAFMVVSLALLGFGASGTALAIFPAFFKKYSRQILVWLSLGCGFSIAGAYLLTNTIPVDSYSIAWDIRQLLILGLHFFVLTLPFFFSGSAVGALIAQSPQSVGKTYAANLIGSSLGCLLALFAPGILGGEGIVTLSSCLAFLAAVIAILENKGNTRKIELLLAGAGLIFVLVDLGLRLNGMGGLSFFKLQLSPYKSLSYTLQQPGSKVESSRWNAFSRIDVVRSPGIHSFPGLSYRYLQPLPAQKGLLIDGDNLNALLSSNTSLQFTAYLPGSIAYQIHPQANVLVLGAGGGLEVLSALSQDAGQIDAVEANPLIISASPVYSNPGVRVIALDDRAYLRNSTARYDVIVLPLNTSFHPIQSGAYSLAEDYRFTVEAFEDVLLHLGKDGVMVATIWLQYPPSEDLRTFSLAVTALEGLQLNPGERIIAFRGYNTATILVKNQAFSSQEIVAVRQFTSDRAFDLIYAPGILPEETNRYNILSEPVYYQTYQSVLSADSRQDFYKQYPYDVTPPSDDHPFFGHYFKWSQAGQVLSEMGKTMQPFGGAGYFVILALLIISIILAGGLILLPLSLAQFRGTRIKQVKSQQYQPKMYLIFFGLIGLAYLFVEIPLIQKFILFLGHPAYAMTAVLFSLLFFSGIGSYLGKKIPSWFSMPLLALIVFLMPSWTQGLFQNTLGACPNRIPDGHPFPGRYPGN